MPFKNGAGNSKAIINPANTTEMICTIGALIMIVTKRAELGGALTIDVVRALRGSVYAWLSTHCSPPGSRNVPPTKSQKNLRQIKPQKPAQKVSADNYSETKDQGGSAATKPS